MSYTSEDPTIVWWKIYYGDFSTFSSEDGSWKAAPDIDIQVILLWRIDQNTRILRGRDYYWYNPQADFYTFGFTNDLFEIKGQVKTGSWTSGKDFTKIYWNVLLDERELYYPGIYERIDPPDYSLVDYGILP